jgi:hypothetical protein
MSVPHPTGEALIAALVELEHHVGQSGWDQPPRLFALVRTELLIASEPALAAELGLAMTADAALTAVEQDDFTSGGDIWADLARIEFPDTVFGCAVSLERTFLPSAFEADIPEDRAAASDLVSRHPERQEIRVVVAADRSGQRYGVARLVSQPDELLGSDELVPGLAEALAHTLA